MNDVENIRIKRNLSALVDFSRIINSSLDLEFILNNVLLTCMGKFLATRGLIAVNIDGKIELNASKGIPDELIKKFPVLESGEKLEENGMFQKYVEIANLHAVEKIRSSDDCLGILCLGEKLNKMPYTEDDLDFLRTILNLAATAVQNSIVLNKLKTVNRALDSRIQRLNSLFELSKEFGLFSESTRVAKLLVYSVIGQFLVSKFAVLTVDGEELQILESKFPAEQIIPLLKEYKLYHASEPMRKNEIKKDYLKLYDLSIELVVPMQIQGRTKGLILLGNRINSMNYTEADIEFVYSVGSLAMISLENQRLFQEALEKQKIEEELEIARDIQRNLLPHALPNFEDFEIAAMNLSSKQVGGDYYDVIKLDNESFISAIADVSGKGVPASLLMANIQAFLKITCKHGIRLDEATALINDLITENTADGKFITFFWGIFNTANKTLNYVNAGHNPPLLIRKGKISKLDKGGIILGVMKTFTPYLQETVNLESGDLLVFFTDGVTEAMNKEGEEFSDELLEELACKNADLSAGDLLNKIESEIKVFTKGAPQSDDITLIIVKVK